MKRLLIVVLLAFAAWQGYGEYKSRGAEKAEPQGIADSAQPRAEKAEPQGIAEITQPRAEKSEPQGIADIAQPRVAPTAQRDAEPTNQFACDGRIHCSQMTSCAEATFFLRNCPGVSKNKGSGLAS